MPKFGVGYPIGLVVWARLGSFPWWPAFVVDRKDHEKTLTLVPDQTLPNATKTNRMVVHFNDNWRVAVLEPKDMLEYSTNVHKVNRAGKDSNDVIDACKEANAYIAAKGLPAQRESLQDINFVLPKKKTTRTRLRSLSPRRRRESASRRKGQSREKTPPQRRGPGRSQMMDAVLGIYEDPSTPPRRRRESEPEGLRQTGNIEERKRQLKRKLHLGAISKEHTELPEETPAKRKTKERGSTVAQNENSLEDINGPASRELLKQEDVEVPDLGPFSQDDQPSAMIDVQHAVDEETLRKGTGDSRGQRRNADKNRSNHSPAKRLADAVERKKTYHEPPKSDVRPGLHRSPAKAASAGSSSVMEVDNQTASGNQGNAKVFAILSSAISSFCAVVAVGDIVNEDSRLEKDVAIRIEVNRSEKHRVVTNICLPLQNLLAAQTQGDAKIVAFLNGVISSFCALHLVGDIPTDESSFVKDVMVRIEVNGSEHRAIMEYCLPLKELLVAQERFGSSSKKN